MRGDAVGSIPSEELRTDIFLILSKPSLIGGFDPQGGEWIYNYPGFML